ncbi:major centromere autoantigen B-like [Parasteatoda tepidariorum]|uniref:major centromere autoantigen B-like n=1 Tax=Parasteatoda tepidariorum TaxID=114398 RepID=UPI0039BC6B3D
MSKLFSGLNKLYAYDLLLEIVWKKCLPLKMSKRKLKTLNLEDKINLINDVDRNPNMKMKDIALKYGIPPNTLSTILKERENILKRYESTNPLSKRMKMCAFPQVESALLKWFQQYRNRENAIPISGVLLREKAIDFAKLLKMDNFHASAGWLEKF